MSHTVDFQDVSTTGVETSPVAPALAGLRANEARYFKNKYSHVFTVQPATEATAVVDWVHDILKTERDLVIESTPLEATAFEVEGIRMAYVFYESGLSINVMYAIEDGGKRRGWIQAVRWYGCTRRARDPFQVRAAEVEACRHDPRLATSSSRGPTRSRSIPVKTGQRAGSTMVMPATVARSKWGSSAAASSSPTVRSIKRCGWRMPCSMSVSMAG